MDKGTLTDMNLNRTSDLVVLAPESQRAVSQICFSGISQEI